MVIDEPIYFLVREYVAGNDEGTPVGVGMRVAIDSKNDPIIVDSDHGCARITQAEYETHKAFDSLPEYEPQYPEYIWFPLVGFYVHKDEASAGIVKKYEREVVGARQPMLVPRLHSKRSTAERIQRHPHLYGKKK